MKPANQRLTGTVCMILALITLLTACSKPASDKTPAPEGITLEASDIQVTEGNSGFSIATVNINLSAASNEAIEIGYRTENGSATEPNDYQSNSGTVTIAAGETTQSFTISIVSDTQPEEDESFNIILSRPQDSTLETITIKVTIEDDDAFPALQVGDINTITEGDSGTTAAVFNITLSTSSSNAVTVDYATSDGTASAPGDYLSKNGTLSFAPGETSKTVTVDVVGDTTPEQDEKFSLTLSNPGNASLNDAIGMATIVNDDTTATLPILQTENISITEDDAGTTAVVFNITLSTSSSSTVTVDYATSDGTASAPSDYLSKNGTLSFAPGETSKTVTVDVIGDVIAEFDETFKLTLSNPDNADLNNNTDGIATIIDNDTDSTALLSNPGPQSFDEEQAYTIDITARPGTRVFVSGMPPGMHWDEVMRRFYFRPDFTQGGKSWQVTMEAVDSAENDTQTFTVEVKNTIQPPWPVFDKREELTGVSKITVLQTTDNFLDAPGFAGREFKANLAIPTAASATNLLPIRIGLHGSGGSPGTVGRATFFGVAPHDPEDSWWTGYSDLKEPGMPLTGGTVLNYTQRRVMHLLSFLTENCPGLDGGCPGADPERIMVQGQSMGATGSLFLAINYGYHFAQISSRIGGTTPYFLSPGHQTQLGKFWGKKELGLKDDRDRNVWELYDSSRALIDNKDFRNLHFSTISGKNDPVIQFTAMVGISLSPPDKERSFFKTLREDGIGHLSVWDQRGHGVNDSPLSAIWWEPLDETSFLKRNMAFPAFSNCSADDDAGTPDGEGGYTGTLRGAKNRYLRWDSANIIDTQEELSMPIKASINTTGTPPNPGYPPRGNDYFGPLPITADVTIRRIQQFQMLPKELINWSYNGESGSVYANDDGSVTVKNLEMTSDFKPLVFTRP